MSGPRKLTTQERIERFWSYVEKTDTCWIWLAGKDQQNYGTFWNGSTDVRAHRFSYSLAHPEWNQREILDHIGCDNPICVNPDHLTPSTNKDNVLRGRGITAENKRKTHCKRGHPYSGENLYVRKDNGERICKECTKQWRKTTNGYLLSNLF